MIDAPRADRDRVCLGIAERAGLCRLEPAGGGRLAVALADSPASGRVAAICRDARDRAWGAYHAVEAFASNSGSCRRRMLLDHFGDSTPTAPSGRCCDICDPDTIGLPDPASLTPARPKSRRAPELEIATIDPAALPLLNALREWRTRASDGKPAYTVAHNSTLEAIAALRPASVGELARIKGVGPTFLERHGAGCAHARGAGRELIVDVFDDLVGPGPLRFRDDEVDIASAEVVERIVRDAACIDAELPELVTPSHRGVTILEPADRLPPGEARITDRPPWAPSRREPCQTAEVACRQGYPA